MIYSAVQSPQYIWQFHHTRLYYIFNPRWHSFDISWFYWKSIIGIMERKWKEILCNFQKCFQHLQFLPENRNSKPTIWNWLYFSFFGSIQVVKYSWRIFEIQIRSKSSLTAEKTKSYVIVCIKINILISGSSRI